MPTALAMAAAGPVGRLVRRLGCGQRHHPVDHLLPERRDARGPGLVAQQPVDPLLRRSAPASARRRSSTCPSGA